MNNRILDSMWIHMFAYHHNYCLVLSLNPYAQIIHEQELITVLHRRKAVTNSLLTIHRLPRCIFWLIEIHFPGKDYIIRFYFDKSATPLSHRKPIM
jgi:hypothetical protein